jgi:hypothetical protein
MTGQPIKNRSLPADTWSERPRKENRIVTQTIDHAAATTGSTNTDLYALVRNTRSWVVVIAWIVVIQATLALGFGAIAGYQAVHARNQAAAQVACVQAGGSLTDCLR